MRPCAVYTGTPRPQPVELAARDTAANGRKQPRNGPLRSRVARGPQATLKAPTKEGPAHPWAVTRSVGEKTCAPARSGWGRIHPRRRADSVDARESRSTSRPYPRLSSPTGGGCAGLPPAPPRPPGGASPPPFGGTLGSGVSIPLSASIASIARKTLDCK